MTVLPQRLPLRRRASRKRSCGRSSRGSSLLTLLLGLLANIAAAVGRRAGAAPGFPGAGAALLVHPGAALRRRRRRVVLGLLMDVGDATLFGQHALAYAVLAYARRIFPPPRAALSAVAAGGAGRGAAAALCAALVLLVRVVGGAPLPRWTYVGAAARRRAAVAAGVGAAAMAAAPAALAGGALATTHGAPTALRSHNAVGEPRASARPSCKQPRARAVPASAAGSSIAGVLVLARVRRAVRPLLLPAGRPARPLPDAGRDQSHRDRADRAQPRRDHRSQRRRARAKLLGLHARDHAVARHESRRDDRRSWPRSSTSSRATASASSKLLEESKNFESLPLRTRLTDEEVARFAVNRYRFPGVEIKARLFRQYPFGEIASHVIGYIGRINDRDVERIDDWDETANYKGSDYIGKVGVELSYERELHGTTGVEEVEVDAGGRAVRTLSRTPPIVRQQPARCRSTSSCRRSPRRRSATAAARWSRSIPRPARCSPSCRKPGFDPNLFVDGIDPANWEELNDSPDKPLLNRPLRGAYPPGSTIKPFLALAALTSGKRTPPQTIFDPGLFPDRRAARTASATTSPAATARSTCTSRSSRPATPTTTCSPARPTSTTPARFMSQFGFGQKTGIDIEGELPGMLPSREWKRAALRRQELSRGASQVVPGRLDLGRASARATTRSRRCSWRRRSRSSPTTASRIAPHLVKSDRERRAPARCARSRREPPHTLAVKPEHLAVIKNALVGVQQGRHQRRGVRRRQVRQRAARPAPRRCIR